MAKRRRITVSERPVSIDGILSASAKGAMKEAFASGPAAIVSPIGEIFYRGKRTAVSGGKLWALVEKLYHEMLQIHTGRRKG